MSKIRSSHQSSMDSDGSDMDCERNRKIHLRLSLHSPEDSSSCVESGLRRSKRCRRPPERFGEYV